MAKYGYEFFAGRADLNQCTRRRGVKPLKKARGAANLRSLQNIPISRACETKLGCESPRERNYHMTGTAPSALSLQNY